MLPNLDLVLDGLALNPADRAGLESLATPQGDAVWRLDAERILSHMAGVRCPGRVTLSNCRHGFPGSSVE